MVTLTIHGCRGSTAYDSNENQEFGGNSSCYTLNTGKDIIMLDAGTGAISAKNEIFDSKPKNLYLLFSHTHHDHVEGLGVSKLPFIPGTNMKIYGKNVRQGLEARLNEDNFPADLDMMPGISEINEARDGDKLELGDVVAEVMEGNHPKHGCNAYRFNVGDNVIVYATDLEFSYDAQRNELDDSQKERYKEFVQGADVLVADAQWTMQEYVDEVPMCIKGWGHSYAEEVLDMAAEAGVKKVILTHHEPERTDVQLTEMEEHAKQYCLDNEYALEVEYARQGAHMEVE